MRPISIAAVVALTVGLGPAPAAAQPAGPTAASSRPPTITFAAGSLLSYANPGRPNLDLAASIQIPAGASLIVEGEIIRSHSGERRTGSSDNRIDRPFVPITTTHIDHNALNIGVNVLFRKAGARFSGFAGGGLGVHRATDDLHFDTSCQPRAPGGCEGRPDTSNHHHRVATGPSWQAIGGVEATLSRYFMAFAADGGCRPAWRLTIRDSARSAAFAPPCAASRFLRASISRVARRFA